MPAHSAPSTAERAVRPGLLLLALALGTTTLSLLQSLVVPVLPHIAEQLGVSAGAAGWVLTANLLAAAVLTPVLGRLGDLRGERPVILGILATITLGTLLAVVTTSLPLLLVARVLQGASYGLFPLSISVLRRELPARRLTVAMSVASSTLAVGGVAGLVVAGLLVDAGGDYRDPFWLGLAVSVVSLALAVWVLPRRPATASGRVDWWGAAVLGAGLALLLLPVSQGNVWGWTSPAVLACLAASAIVLSGWVVLQHRMAEPLVRPAMLADRRTVVPNVAGLLTGVTMFVFFLTVLQYVQAAPEVAGYGFGVGVLEAAVVYLLPGGVLGIVVAPLAGHVVGRVGALPTLLAGAASGVAGFALLAFLRGTPWVVVVAGALAQLSVTVTYAALPALVVQAVEPAETGVANAVNSISRSVGQAAGSTLAVALLAVGTQAGAGAPPAWSFTALCLIGVGGAAAVVVVAGVGLRAERRSGRGPARRHGPDELAGVEEATAGAGEWSPVSGIR